MNLEQTKIELKLSLLSLLAVSVSFANIIFGIIVIILLSIHSLNLFYSIYFQEPFYKMIFDKFIKRKSR